MKKRDFWLILSLFAIFGCSQTPEKGTGYLTLNLSQGAGVKADVMLSGFILRISNGQVDVLKERISDLPPEIALPEGVYTIEAYDMVFDEPKFATPFYYGKQTNVVIEAGETNVISLVCSQGNAGVKVVWAGSFSNLFRTYYARIDDGNGGYLHYSSTETRTGYFLPGTVTISILADGLSIHGGTITLNAKDLVTAHLQPVYTESPSGDVTIEIIIDETINPREIEVTVDPDEFTGANSESNPYSIAQAILRQGESAVWITGYIVGSKPSSAYDFVNGIWQDTNIVLADKITETDDANVIFVQLPSGNYRNQLKLDKEDPENINLHRKVMIKGNLTTYFQRNGLMNVSGCSFP